MIQFRREDVPHHEYVFLYVDVFGVSLGGAGGRGQPWARGDQDDPVAREAFQVRLTTSSTGGAASAVLTSQQPLLLPLPVHGRA